MKNIATLLLFFLMLSSCGKKEVKKENTESKEPQTETIVTEVEEVAEPEVQEYTPELLFTVQIAALRKQNEDLYSIDGISTYDENGLTKFRLGNFKTYREARVFRKEILSKYKGAFVQALKNGIPISISEALQN